MKNKLKNAFGFNSLDLEACENLRLLMSSAIFNLSNYTTLTKADESITWHIEAARLTDNLHNGCKLIVAEYIRGSEGQ